MGLFKKKPWRGTADSNKTPSSPIEDEKCSHHRELETYDSDAAITDYDVTDSEEESNKQPRGDATTPHGNNISCEHGSSAVPSIQENHRLTMIIPDRRHRHFLDDKVLKRVTIAETNKVVVLKDIGSKSEPYDSTISRSATVCRNSDYKSVIVNPFEYRRDVYLGRDMAYVADAMNLDANTQAMLALYDAKSLEDFSLMAHADMHDLVRKAQSMRRAIPPLQVRKIEVLREWIQEISRPKDESQMPAWARRDRTRRRKSRRLIPSDWKEQFEIDLPVLKQKLQAQSSSMSIFQVNSFASNFRILTMCGLVE